MEFDDDDIDRDDLTHYINMLRKVKLRNKTPASQEAMIRASLLLAATTMLAKHRRGPNVEAIQEMECAAVNAMADKMNELTAPDRN